MKAEAGVGEHQINRRALSGRAYLDAGKIYSPEGRNIAQLYVLAHECGHIFLQRAGGPGYRLPSHVKELEAESYAHQAFRHHGMRVPKHVTRHARSYVETWIKKDRAAGWRIDERAEQFSRGLRSPYEPLRDIPITWRRTGARSLPKPLAVRLRELLGVLRPVIQDPIWAYARRMFGFAVWQWIYAFTAIMLVTMLFSDLEFVQRFVPDAGKGEFSARRQLTLHSYAILWSCCALSLRTMIGRWPASARERDG
ncbi:MAG: hypothetical protein AB1749_13960 [Pseudomonadota bacterium]